MSEEVNTTNTGKYNSGDLNRGNRNSGYKNSGNRNSGNRNSGNWNTGDYNIGSSNTGNHNRGNHNSGIWNTGNRNSGIWNSGNHNSGDCNSGDYNSGDYNSGNHNSGYCNSITPEECYIFNKASTRTAWKNAYKPSWLNAELTKWIEEKDMTDKEKEAFPSYVTTGGYLKAYASLKHAYIEAWEQATQEDKGLTRQLPNFDEEVFEEVFGFNPWKQLKKSVTLELTDDQLSKIKKILED